METKIFMAWLKKLIPECMQTNFGGRDLSSFGDTTTLKNGHISLLDHGL